MKRKSCIQILQLCFAALPTIVFGVFTIVFTLKQDASARATREQDQRIADETNRRILFKEYIDDVKELLLNEKSINNFNQTAIQIKALTSAVLQDLDPKRKLQVISYLYENHLIRTDNKEAWNILKDVNLNDVEFIRSSTQSCYFPRIYLNGVFAHRIKFIGCFLDHAIFDSASLAYATFDSCSLEGTSFAEANLTAAQFISNVIFQANMSNALLRSIHVRNGLMERTNFMNADLFQADISNTLLYAVEYSRFAQNSFVNARLPNGSYGSFDHRNLISKEKAYAQCVNDNSKASWNKSSTDTYAQSLDPLVFINETCAFKIEQNSFVAIDTSVKQFSTLIDDNLAMFNFTLRIGLKLNNWNDSISIHFYFASNGGVIHIDESFKHTFRNLSFHDQTSISHDIPVRTRLIGFWITCETAVQPKQQCLYDALHLIIYKRMF